jgi:predicted ATPase/transcriptional regulator with XRE-family HTH domain
MAGLAADSFGALLRRYRERAHLSQEELADRAGLSVNGISALERGVRRQPQTATLRRLADALGLAGDDRARFLDATLPNAPPMPPIPTTGPPLLVAAATPLIGREREEAAIVHLLRHPGAPFGPRLLTLTGPGGAGKTRLALQVGATVQDDYPDGVAFISLASLREATLVANAIASALGVADQPTETPEAAVTRFLLRKRILLILDNFDHLLAATPFLSALLAACPGLTLLVTSRAPLRLKGEQEFAVPSLALPPRDATVLERIAPSPAVELFVQRARSVRPDFELDRQNGADIAAICRRLDGLPLAIELVAARTRLFSPTGLLYRLTGVSAPLAVATGGERDAPARHQSLRDAVAWSYALLSPDEQALFRRLAVFAGGFTVEAVAGVADQVSGVGFRVSGPPSPPTPDTRNPTPSIEATLERLVEHSLLRVVDDIDGEPWFAMLETIRGFAWDILEASGEASDAQRQHAAHVVGWFRDGATNGRSYRERLGWVERNVDNVRQALAWCRTNNPQWGLELVSPWASLYKDLGHFAESRQWLEELLAGAPEPTVARGRALLTLADSAMHLQDRKGIAYATEALTIGRTLAEPSLMAGAAAQLGLCLSGLPDVQNEQRALFDEALTIARTVGNPQLLIWVLRLRGYHAMIDHDFELGERLLLEALALAEASGSHHLGDIVNYLGQLARTRGDFEGAIRWLEQSIAIFERDGNVGKAAWSRCGLADPLLSAGRWEQARTVIVEALEFFRGRDANMVSAVALWCEGRRSILTGSPHRGIRLIAKSNSGQDPNPRLFTVDDRMALYDATTAQARAALGDEAYRQAWAVGVAMSDEEAIAYALADDANADVTAVEPPRGAGSRKHFP